MVQHCRICPAGCSCKPFEQEQLRWILRQAVLRVSTWGGCRLWWTSTNTIRSVWLQGLIFKELDECHGHSKNIYCLTEEAHVEFVAFHDELNERKRGQHRWDRDRKSVLSKAKGQVVRLAAVTFALHQVINTVSEEGNREHPAWSFAILCEFVQRAIVLMNFCIDQKFALGKPPFQPSEVHWEEDKECVVIDEHRVKRLLELASPITVTKIHSPIFRRAWKRNSAKRRRWWKRSSASILAIFSWGLSSG